MRRHPNASVAGGSGALGILLVWILGQFGVALPPEVAAAISTAAATLALVIGRRGLSGLARLIWRGETATRR